MQGKLIVISQKMINNYLLVDRNMIINSINLELRVIYPRNYQNKANIQIKGQIT